MEGYYRAFNSDSFVTSPTLTELCALLSAVLVTRCIFFYLLLTHLLTYRYFDIAANSQISRALQI